jgi:hypothetical protein
LPRWEFCHWMMFCILYRWIAVLHVVLHVWMSTQYMSPSSVSLRGRGLLPTVRTRFKNPVQSVSPV